MAVKVQKQDDDDDPGTAVLCFAVCRPELRKLSIVQVQLCCVQA